MGMMRAILEQKVARFYLNGVYNLFLLLASHKTAVCNCPQLKYCFCDKFLITILQGVV